MKIEILGTGCAKCDKLEQNARAAAAETGVPCTIVKVKDLAEIAARGVMLTPALLIDGLVVTSGRVLSVEEIAEHLQEKE